jgi:hypothetical protein
VQKGMKRRNEEEQPVSQKELASSEQGRVTYEKHYSRVAKLCCFLEGMLNRLFGQFDVLLDFFY